MDSRLMRDVTCGILLATGLALRADVSITMAGPELTVGVPASHAGDKVVLCWGDADKGVDTNAWSHVRELTDSVPNAGARYTVDLNEVGYADGQICRVLSLQPYWLLDKVGAFASGQTYVETVYKDTDCHGVEFGFYSTEKTKDWGGFIGTSEGSSPNYGFVMSLNGASNDAWFWTCSGTRSGVTGAPRPPVLTDRFNVVTFRDGTFMLNGSAVSTGRTTSPIGKNGSLMRIGRTYDSRYQNGWWSHVRFLNSAGGYQLDYVPALDSRGRACFFDRVTSKLVYSSGTADFTAGTATNAATIVRSSKLVTVKDFAPLSISMDGTRLTAQVPSNYAGDQLVLVWDNADKGQEPSDWTHVSVLAAAIPTEGCTLSTDLALLGIPRGQYVCVFALHQFAMLDKAKVSAASYVDTGVKDTDGYRATFGFYAETSDYTTTDWGIFMGNYDGDSNDRTGFVLSLANGNPEVWYWKCCGYRSGNRPTVSKSAINEATVSQSGFIVNGQTVQANLNYATLGTRNTNIHLGRGSEDYRHQAGWWSHVEIEGVDGRNLIEYVPVRRTGDGKVCFYDRVSHLFVGPTGSGDMEAGAVTNASVTIVHRRSDVLQPRLPQPFEVTVDGSLLTVKASSLLAQEGLQLAWDGHTHELADFVPAEGGTYQVDLSTLEGGMSASEYTVQSVQKMDLIDKIKMPDSTCYINTGVRDSDCHGVAFGFLGTQKTEAFANFIGTEEAHGFTVGANNTLDDSWYWTFYNGKQSPRPSVSTTEINEAEFANGVFTLNGDTVNDSLHKGAVGTSGKYMYVGAASGIMWRYWFGWWSYVRFHDAGGNAAVDYIPARRRSDGKVGFFDRAMRMFVFSSSTGTFEAGSTTNENVSVVRLQRSFTLGGLIKTAVWTGEGDVTRYEDPTNWSCTNFVGEAISGIPGPETRVFLPTELQGDCNLVGLSSDKIALSATDLKGHVLTLPVDTDFPQAATVTDTVGGGELRLDVADGVVAINSTIGASGLVKVVKVGLGTLVASKAGQTYTGGLLVSEGTFACGGKGSDGVYGDPANTIVVAAGATFACNGYNGHSAAKLLLDGGTVANSEWHSGTIWQDWFADVTLAADSFVLADRYLLFSNADGAAAALEMNGHTLTLDIDGNCGVGMINVTVTGGGTIYQRTGGFLVLGDADGTGGVTAETTTLIVEHSLRVHADSIFGEYVASYAGGWDQGAAKIKVLKRFCPEFDGVLLHSAELQNGAVLDLSKVTTTWTAYGKNTHFDYEQALSFAKGATIAVATGDRQLVLGDQLVAWKARPSDVTFVWSLDLPLTARGRGLFVQERKGMAILVR